MTTEISSAHASGGARAEAHVVVVAGWDERALLVLAIIFTGGIPLAVGTGLTVGLTLPFISAWHPALRVLAGVASAALAFAILVVLLRAAGTSYRFRQRFIPFARKMFPPSDQMRP